jgi:hypothetical protein
VKFPYKPFPLSTASPITKQDVVWRPAVKVLLWYNHKRSVPIESILDTGADYCMFTAEIGESLGIPVAKGIPVRFTGVLREASTTGFLHRLDITIASQTFEAPIVFAYGLTSAGILGQVGFFDHFIAAFDWTPDPPCFDIQRIHRN